jgi:hypothetical protein
MSFRARCYAAPTKLLRVTGLGRREDTSRDRCIFRRGAPAPSSLRARKLINASLIATPLRPQPGERVGIEADGKRLLQSPLRKHQQPEPKDDLDRWPRNDSFESLFCGGFLGGAAPNASGPRRPAPRGPRHSLQVLRETMSGDPYTQFLTPPGPSPFRLASCQG